MPLDLRALGISAGVNAAIGAACLGALTLLRAACGPTRRFYAPKRYSRSLPASARLPRLRWWAWMWQTARLPGERLLVVAGTDGAQYMKALNMALHLFLLLSVWCVGVVLPVNMSGSEVATLMAGQDPGPTADSAAAIAARAASEASRAAAEAAIIPTSADTTATTAAGTTPLSASSVSFPTRSPSASRPSPHLNLAVDYPLPPTPSTPSPPPSNASGANANAGKRAATAASGEVEGEAASASPPGTPGAGSHYVFSDLDRLSLANIAPGSRLMWVHLLSVYVLTAVTLAVLWSHSRGAVALRLMHVTRAAPGGSSHTVMLRDIPGLEYGTRQAALRRWLAGAVLLRCLPRRARSGLEAAVQSTLGGATSGINAASALAGSPGRKAGMADARAQSAAPTPG
ncbi:hypothetical protein GPECTOR_56g338 [Gonium pectorale]|uniref:CSC1/OSCA1-like N-terminal transmembrane domain-containing protein n=1 Tax=Gonium pectorale TaxID=33097 RepID=A0A150G5W5_GONPE|nr:hypothetical protein GPECTOR_56g338 [Gonium pectorale]|eukprot:KXZ45242.1 hypothetical protein GPECTOR_56g338 [Gonium pectorale]